MASVAAARAVSRARMCWRRSRCALAALHRREPCGFSLNTRGTWVEWTARPVGFLALADPIRSPPTAYVAEAPVRAAGYGSGAPARPTRNLPTH
ncbi:hypothetical protein [Streptomyces sp. NPDC127084]|uniref:hypothetical protein n=1 Tax=Streptomyces sp. NPDC127084 TaxID=3347133 RepID=UPI00366917DC